MCAFTPSDPQPNYNEICVFDIHYAPSGPFVTAQSTYFIPISEYERAVSWTMANRRGLDVFVHPNTGCGIQDHVMHSLWGGNKWAIDASIFLS